MELTSLDINYLKICVCLVELKKLELFSITIKWDSRKVLFTIYF